MAPSLVSADPTTLARFFRVLGDPTRLRLIRALESGERSVGELVVEVGQRQPRVSAHLACLRHCGLVEHRRQGREMLYRLSLGNLRTLIDRAAELTVPLGERLATCTRIGPDWV